MPTGDSDIPVAASSYGGQARAEARLLASAALAVAAATIAVFYLPFLLGEKNFFHDSLAHANLLGLFYDRLFSGDSWLWSAALNAGHPLWVGLEVAPIVDPVAFVSYALAIAFGSGWLLPYYVSAFVWLFAFAAGSALCAHWLTGNRWAALFTFLLLFAGPFALSVPAQSSGLLNPFRYFPLALYFYLRLRESVAFDRALAFVTVLAVSLAGYQSVYPFIMYLTLVLAELLAGGRAYLAWLARLCRPRYLCLVAIPLIALAPTIAWLDYTRWMVALPWEYGRSVVYFIPPDEFLRDFLLTYLLLFKLAALPSVYHGTAFIGFLATPLFLLGLRRSLLNGVSIIRGRNEADPAIRFTWILALWLAMTLVLIFGLFGLQAFIESKGSILGIRNFGYLLTGALVVMVLLAAYGFAEVVARRYSLVDVAVDSFLFAALAFTAHVWIDRSDLKLQSVGGLSIAFLLATSCLWFLRSRSGGPRLALPVLAALFLEFLVLGGMLMPSLEFAAVFKRVEGINALVRARDPRLGGSQETLPTLRELVYPATSHWPFQLEGPAVFDLPSAYTEPVIPTPIGIMGMKLTHLFRLRNYHGLVAGPAERAYWEEILGVTRPILELVSREALDEAEEGYRLVLRERREPEAAPPAGRVLEVDYAGDRVTVALEAAGESVLVYRDNIAPGWSVAVDGEDAALLVVDRVNKAVAVPPGKHEVEFLYRPWAYLVTFALRAVVLVLSALACLAVFVRSQRARHPS